MKKVGVIGVGKMGKAMTENVINSFDVYVYDVQTANVNAVVTKGAKRCDSEVDVVRQADVILLSLPDVPVLQSVIRKILHVIHGKTIIDTTTSTMKASQDLAQQVATHGGQMLDAPVTGGVWGAQQASLRFFVGGDKSAYDDHLDVFRSLGSHYVHIGPSGHGQVGKMVCQMIGSVTYVISAEALGLASQLGVDIHRVVEAFGEDKPGTTANILHMMETGSYGDEGYMAQRSKDIDYCVEEAARNKAYIPMTQAMNQVYTLARQQGLGDMNPDVIYKVWEAILGHPLDESPKKESE